MKYIAFLILVGSVVSCGTIKSTSDLSPKNDKQSFAQKMADVINENGLDEGISWFNSNKNSKAYHFKEEELNGLGYSLLYDLKKGNAAIEVFELNIKYFPESGNAYDSAAEAYLKKGDFEKSIEYYTKAADLLQKKNIHHLGFLSSHKYIPTKIPNSIESFFVAEGNWENEIAFVYLQGGPDFELHINERDGLHLIENNEEILKIYPYQSPMLNSNLFIAEPTITHEQSTFENAQSVELLDKTVSYLTNKGKRVFVIGHSYGASICLEYLNTKEVLAEKVVLMGMDLDEDISSWSQLKPGEFIRWENGIQPIVKDVFGWIPEDYPKQAMFDNIVENLEMLIRVNMEKKYTTLISPETIKKTVSVYASADEANGVKSKDEIIFLESNEGLVHKVEGDHHSMLTTSFMTKLYNHLVHGTSLE